MSQTGSVGSDAKISGSKIEPLDSTTKEGVSRADGGGGAAGSDHNIDQARISPEGGQGQFQNPESHADSHGAVGRDADIQASKIDPLVSQAKAGENAKPDSGLRDEEVDAARIQPMGEVREEMPK